MLKKTKIVYFLFLSMFFVVNVILLTSNSKNNVFMNMASADWEYPEDPPVGQVLTTYWEETSECTLWTINGFGFPICLQYTTTRTEMQDCLDNYVCPSCTC